MKCLSIVLIFLTSNLSAQIANLTNASNITFRAKKYTLVKGSPYLFDDYKIGKFWDISGIIYEDYYIKYNLYEDVIEVVEDQKVLALLKAVYPSFEIEYIDESTKTRQLLHFENEFIIDGYRKFDYFQVLYSGKTRLLKRRKVKLIETSEKSYGESTTFSQFVKSEDLILLHDDGRTVKFKRKAKDIISALSNHKIDIKEFIKTKKISLKNDSDIIKVIKYFDSL